MYGVREQWEASVSEGGGEWFDDVDDFEIQHGEECDFGRSGFKVGVNEREFVIGVRFQVEELHCEISGRIANGCGGTSGIGMSDEDIPKALSSFGQIDSKLSRKYEGTGLGLPLTKKLVELMNGTFDIKSTVGQGTTITIIFQYTEIVSV